MDDWSVAQVEVELEIERREKENSDGSATGTNSGCGTVACLFVGLPFLLLVAEILHLLF